MKGARAALDGKVAVVTGGAAGIGAGITRSLLLEGARVVVADIQPDTEDWAQAHAIDPDRAVAVSADVTDDEDIERVMQAAIDHFGGLDIVVNNAGMLRFTPADSLTREDWNAVISLNLAAPAFCTKAALPHLRARGAGAIVNVSSIQAALTGPRFAAYAASKAGLLGLTRSLALELGPDGIRVNAVLPGYTRTSLFMADAGRLGNGDPERFIDELTGTIALRRIGEPEDIAGVVTFLCSDDARYVTGAALAVDAGVTVQL